MFIGGTWHMSISPKKTFSDLYVELQGDFESDSSKSELSAIGHNFRVLNASDEPSLSKVYAESLLLEQTVKIKTLIEKGSLNSIPQETLKGFNQSLRVIGLKAQESSQQALESIYSEEVTKTLEAYQNSKELQNISATIASDAPEEIKTAVYQTALRKEIAKTALIIKEIFPSFSDKTVHIDSAEVLDSALQNLGYELAEAKYCKTVRFEANASAHDPVGLLSSEEEKQSLFPPQASSKKSAAASLAKEEELLTPDKLIERMIASYSGQIITDSNHERGTLPYNGAALSISLSKKNEQLFKIVEEELTQTINRYTDTGNSFFNKYSFDSNFQDQKDSLIYKFFDFMTDWNKSSRPKYPTEFMRTFKGYLEEAHKLAKKKDQENLQ